MLETLDWYGPKPLYAEPANNSALYMHECNMGGVYLWLIPVNQTYYVNYVGEGGHIANRLDDHIREFMTGRYWLYDPESLKAGTRGHNENFYNPSERRFKSLEFLTLGNHYIDRVRQLLATIHILAAHVERAWRKRVESGIIRAVREAGDPASALLDNYRAAPMPSEPVSILCKWPISIKGLSDTILV